MGTSKSPDENSGKIKNPHDKFFKETLSIKENARSFLENYLPAEILNLMEIGTLEIEKDSFVTQALEDYYSDLLYKVKFSGHDGYPGIQREKAPEVCTRFRVHTV